MKKKIAAINLVIMMMITMFLPITVQAASAQTPRVVKVGCMDIENFSQQQEDGSITGYCADYLKKIAEYGNFRYEYVFGDWNQLREMLKAGEVDVICTTKNDTENFDYTQEPFVETLSAIYARADDDFYYDDYQKMNGSDIGIIENSFHKTYFEQYAKTKGFTYQEHLYATKEEALSALCTGEVDAIATDSVSGNDTIKCVGTFGTELMYLCTRKGDTLVDEFNYAVNDVTNQQYSFKANLFVKYFGETQTIGHNTFTREEAEFIKNCPELTMAFSSDMKPMAYTDTATGETIGITPELMKKISEISGIHFNYYPLAGQSNNFDYDYFRENKIDLIAGIEVNKYNENVAGLTLSDVYFSATKVLVGKSGNSVSQNGKATLAYVGGSTTLPYVIADIFPNYTLKAYDKIEDCLQAVEDGDADVLLYNQYLINQYLGKPRYEDLMIIPQISVSENLTISPVSYEGHDETKAEILNNPLLMSILDKSIHQITEEDKNEIVIRYTVEQDKGINLADVIFKYRYSAIGILVLLCIIFFMYTYSGMNRKKTLVILERKNEQLANLVEVANDASTTKSRFLAQMSHEIRTPMNAIVGMTALAQKVDKNPQKTSEYLKKIDLSSHMLLNIINDVLDMSAIENNKIKIAKEPFDLMEVLTQVSMIYYSQCSEKGINYDMTIADVMEENVIGDSLRVNQILMNLLSNAYKFTEPGGKIKVTVSEDRREENKVYIKFIVADTGCGMSENLIKRIYGAFEQEDASTAKKYGGSGLGMAITKAMVDLMHGAIDVQSTVGEGTTFTVTIPFVIADNVIKPDVSVLKELRVLVIDDDIDVLNYTASILAEMGVVCDIESDAKRALHHIEEAKDGKNHYDVCFIDWKMPEISGLEMTKQIRKEIGEDILVVIISAYDLTEVQEQAIQAGANQMIAKPFYQSSVFNALMTAQRKKQAKTQSDEKAYDFTGHKVLLAEDFELNRDVAIDILGEVHLQVECAENGKEAYEMFTNSEPGTYELILMDVQMPIMDGYEATKAIRNSKHPEAQSIPIYAMTANAFTEDVSNSLAAGMNGHIAKPIDTAGLYHILEEEIHNK